MNHCLVESTPPIKLTLTVNTKMLHHIFKSVAICTKFPNIKHAICLKSSRNALGQTRMESGDATRLSFRSLWFYPHPSLSTNTVSCFLPQSKGDPQVMVIIQLTMCSDPEKTAPP